MIVERPRTFSAVWRSILVCVLYLAAMTGIYAFFICSELGQRLDASSFAAVVNLRTEIGTGSGILRLSVPGAAGFVLFVLLVIALVHRQLRDAFAVVALSAITAILSTVLKNVVVYRPFLGDYGYSHNTFPSGHMAVTTSILIGCYWLLPRRLRKPLALVPLIILGAANGLFQVTAYAHRPSDVFGGALVAAAVAAIFVGRGGALPARWRWSFWALVVVLAAVGVLCLVSWESSGYATDEQNIATTGILLTSAAGAGAALILGAERHASQLPSRPGARELALQDPA